MKRFVVIGAGVGGLAAAIRLAAAGCRVTVLEAAAAPGGKMRTLPSEAGPVDAGPTVLTLRDVFEDLFAFAGARLSDHVTLHPEPLLARHHWPDGSTLDLHVDADESAAAIRDFAGPKAEAQFHRFHAEAGRLFDAFDAPVMRAANPTLVGLTLRVMADPAILRAMAPLSTLAQRLARRFEDPRLAQLFGRYATYVGGSPYGVPGLLALIWRAEAAGVWRVEGGMAALARAMAGLAERLGAEIACDTPVRRIEVQGGRARAVIDAHGRRHPCEGVVFNGDPRALRQGLLGADVMQAVPESAVEPRSLSAEVWAFAARPSGVDLVHHNVFFGPDPATEFGPIAEGRTPQDPTIYVCAQDRGHGLAMPTGPERFEIIVNAAPLSPEEAPPCPTPFETLSRRGLTFDPPPTGRTGPAEFAALFPGSLGSLYGRSPEGTMAAFARPRARTTIKGLVLAGGGAHPGAGVPMATLSGKHAAEAILSGRTSTSTSPPTATRGGTSTPSPTAARAPSRS